MPLAMFCSRFLLFFALGVLSIGRIVSIPVSDFYPFGNKVHDAQLPSNDDGSSPEVLISSPFTFFNSQQKSLFVNTNGVISFQQKFDDHMPRPFPLGNGRRIVAPFWADVNIRKNGTVWYRESTNITLLTRASGEIQRYYPSLVNFRASWIFIATWFNVPFFGANKLGITKRNTFQAVLVTNGRHSFTIFNYNVIEWTTGTISGGSSSTGLAGSGGTAAQVGFDGGDGVNYFALKESGTNAILQLATLTNVGLPGKFVFRIDAAAIENGGCTVKGPLTITPRYIPMFGGKLITLSGPCINEGDSTKIAFGSSNFSRCARRSKFSVECSTPILYTSGDLQVRFTITTANQQDTLYLGLVTLLNPISSPPTLNRLNPSVWKKNSMVTIAWNDEELPFKVIYAKLDIYTVQTSSSGLPVLSLHKTISVSKTFLLDVDADVAVISMSATNQDELTQSVWSDVFYVQPDTQTITNDRCLLWQERDKQFADVHNLEVQECPCILDQATVDMVRFHDDPNCHELGDSYADKKRRSINCIHQPHAERCFRLNTPGPRNTGRLCCYNRNGNLMDARSSKGGGTLHRNHYLGGPKNVPYLSHFMDDLTPYLYCCVNGNPSTCSQYVARRPTGDCRRYAPVTTSRIGGDPHFTTFDGLEYTFNGVGEFVLIKHTNDTFMTQVRMEQFKDVKGTLQRASVITAFAARSINVSDTVEVQLNTSIVADILINGENKDVDFMESESLDFKGVSVTSTTVNGTDGSLKQFNVVFKNPPIAFRVLAYPSLLNVFILAGSEKLKDKVDGLLGNYNGILTDDLRTINGTAIPLDSNLQTIHHEVGLRWRVSEFNSLFTYSRGKSHSSYQNPHFVPSFDIPTNPSDTAREICGNDTSCLYDYHTTGGDASIARTTKSADEVFVEMKKKAVPVVSCGFPKEVHNGYWNSTGTLPTATATLICYNGYVSVSAETITCNESGQWTGSSTSTCNAVVHDKDWTATLRIMVIGVSVGACMVTTIVIGFVCLKKRKTRNTQRA